MMLIKTFVAALVIAFSSWLAGRKPVLAGFIVALPLTTLLVLPFSQLEWKDSANSVHFAKSIFVAVPVSLLFFLPFLFAEKLKLGFWWLYMMGVALLVLGYFIHQALMK